MPLLIFSYGTLINTKCHSYLTFYVDALNDYAVLICRVDGDACILRLSVMRCPNIAF